VKINLVAMMILQQPLPQQFHQMLYSPNKEE
jgi:hypothetical protein